MTGPRKFWPFSLESLLRLHHGDRASAIGARAKQGGRTPHQWGVGFCFSRAENRWGRWGAHQRGAAFPMIRFTQVNRPFDLRRGTSSQNTGYGVSRGDGVRTNGKSSRPRAPY
ncbi:MAG: hypothetical protein CM15mP103_03920 [Gammaproteobacteria bacterium]|nr:MAG: hypothetical protein CM15mP103_03920 [Gammaproteobacteria bacterium]